MLSQSLMELELIQRLSYGAVGVKPVVRGSSIGVFNDSRGTWLGTIELCLPRVYNGSFFSSILYPADGRSGSQ